MLLDIDMCETPVIGPAAVTVTLLKLTILRTQAYGPGTPRSNWCFQVTLDGSTRYWGFANVTNGLEFRLDWQRTVPLRKTGSTAARGFEIVAAGQNVCPGALFNLPAVSRAHNVADDWGLTDPTFSSASSNVRTLEVDGEYAYRLEYIVEPAFDRSRGY
jgi:hypothetical protein